MDSYSTAMIIRGIIFRLVNGIFLPYHMFEQMTNRARAFFIGQNVILEINCFPVLSFSRPFKSLLLGNFDFLLLVSPCRSQILSRVRTEGFGREGCSPSLESMSRCFPGDEWIFTNFGNNFLLFVIWKQSFWSCSFFLWSKVWPVLFILIQFLIVDLDTSVILESSGKSPTGISPPLIAFCVLITAIIPIFFASFSMFLGTRERERERERVASPFPSSQPHLFSFTSFFVPMPVPGQEIWPCSRTMKSIASGDRWSVQNVLVPISGLKNKSMTVWNRWCTKLMHWRRKKWPWRRRSSLWEWQPGSTRTFFTWDDTLSQVKGLSPGQTSQRGSNGSNLWLLSHVQVQGSDRRLTSPSLKSSATKSNVESPEE